MRNISSVRLLRSSRPRCREASSPRWYSTSPGSPRDLPTVGILEVGPRDGLQNVKEFLPTPLKIEFIRRLSATGLRYIEATSFVSPKWVPQLGDGAEVMKESLPLTRKLDIRTPVLTPNLQGLENAIQSGAQEAVVFSSATEEFVRLNQNCTLEAGLDDAQKVAKRAREHGLAVRGVVSCIFADPYTGPADPEKVLYVVKRLLGMGCYEVALGDTVGVGTPENTKHLLRLLLQEIPAEKLAGHFHDTYGQALANVAVAYEMGIRKFDTSVAGLGGCPYAKGAKGNLATEDMVYMFEQSGVSTGINLEELAAVGQWISGRLKIANGSRAGAAIIAKRQSNPGVSLTKTTSSSQTWAVVEENEEFVVTRAGNTVKIILNRPQKGNKLTVSMLEGLKRTFTKLAEDPTVFHIVISAKGKYFCTGMDLSGKTEVSGVSQENSYFSKVVALYEAIENSPQTTIALVQGPCFGGGVGLTFACDIRLASATARWTLSEIKLGLSPAIISKLMSREWGIPFFREAILTGREVTPEELLRIGAVHQVVEDETTLDQLLESYLSVLSGCAPHSATACKALVLAAWADAGGQKQSKLIKDTFDAMTAPGSEGEYGMQQFQKKVKKTDWGTYWATKASTNLLKQT